MKGIFDTGSFVRSVRGALWVALGLAVFSEGSMAGTANDCLNDSDRKVCASLEWTPDTAQPSQQNGTKTFVNYHATLVNALHNSASRYVLLTMSWSPATPVKSFSADNGATCTVGTGSVQCSIDKLDDINPIDFDLVVETPTSPGTLTNTLSFGWQGNTDTLVSSVPITRQSGESWQPAGQSITLSTAEPNPDPSLQTTPGDPVYGELTIPAVDYDRYVFIRVVTNGPDRLGNCVGGVYLATNSDGGPYLCRDLDTPTRWVQIGVDDTAGMQLKLIEDASLVQAVQLAPTLLAPTGTPPFAVFAQGEPTQTDPDPAFRAIGKTCDSNPRPCVKTVTKFGTGDWAATIAIDKVNLGDPDPLLPGGVGIFGLIPPIGNFN